MLNRRLIRIKVFKVLYSSVSSGVGSWAEADRQLRTSCEKTLHLYYFMLRGAIALKEAADAKIEVGLKKYNPTSEEREPNRKFSENLFVKALLEDKRVVEYTEEHGLLWTQEQESFIKRLYSKISDRDYFREYMNSPERSLKEDCDLFMKIYGEEFEDNEEFEADLEDMSLYWMDDLGYVLCYILQGIDYMKRHERLPKVDLFLKEDDREFAEDLLKEAFLNYRKYEKIVHENVSNYDPERVVSTDIMLVSLAVAEAVKFPNIPLKVTINEYVEISKYYSTANSRLFVNGLLDRILNKMQKSGEIVKTGRGLIGGGLDGGTVS